MRQKILIVLGLMSFMLNVNAIGAHVEQKSPAQPKNNNVKANVGYAGYCEIEVVNRSYEDIVVRGMFDDGALYGPIVVQASGIFYYSSPLYISLAYYGYCDYGMRLDIATTRGYPVYGAYTAGGSTVRID